MVRVVDRGWNAMIDRLNRARNMSSKVGYLTGEDKEDDSGISVLEVAIIHEFGAPKANIPMRSHVRTAYDEDVDNLSRKAEEEYGKVIDGTSTPEESLSRLGEYHKRIIQKKIRTGPFVALKPQTIARKKGSSKPLIDTGQMINSVTHVEGVFS